MNRPQSAALRRVVLEVPSDAHQPSSTRSSSSPGTFVPMRPPLRRVTRKDEPEELSSDFADGRDPTMPSQVAPGTPTRDVPVDWEALEDAFENNAPEVHSYLHLVTGDVLRIEVPQVLLDQDGVDAQGIGRTQRKAQVSRIIDPLQQQQ